MTTLLPSEDLTVLRNIAKSAAVLFTWMMIEKNYPCRPVTEYQFADLLNIDIRTVQKQLRALSSAGLAMFQGNFTWMLTPNGRNTLFGESREASHLSIEGSEPVYLAAVYPTQNVSHEAHFVPHDDDELTNTINVIESSSSLIERTFCATTKQILQHTNLLFGSSVSINRTVESRDPIHALCWVSKAWADRKKLQNPAGLVYKRLSENQHPPVYLRDDPAQGLPDDYLVAIGYKSAEAESNGDDEISVEDDPEPEQKLPEDNSPAAQIWKVICENLERDMPHNYFEEYVSKARAVNVDDSILTVCAENQNSSNWLEGRLESTVNRLLIGISYGTHVRFVSAGGA